VNEDVIRTLLTVAFGAIAGGSTNAVAVWMLFHPYEPPVLFGRRIRFLQGAIPKNTDRLASRWGARSATSCSRPTISPAHSPSRHSAPRSTSG
jgi:hypothetical protein